VIPAPRDGRYDCGFETSAGLGEVAEEIVWGEIARDGAPARRLSPHNRLFR